MNDTGYWINRDHPASIAAVPGGGIRARISTRFEAKGSEKPASHGVITYA